MAKSSRPSTGRSTPASRTPAPVEQVPPASPGWWLFATIVVTISAFANLLWGFDAVRHARDLAEAGFGHVPAFGALSFWGWVAIGWGTLLAVAAVLLWRHSPAAKVMVLTLAVLSFMFWLIWLPAFPVFAVVGLVLDALLIFAMTVQADGATGSR